MLENENQYSETQANADALRYARRRVRSAAKELAASERWRNADAVERIILRAEMLEECSRQDADEGESGPARGFLNDRPAERIADAILGRIGKDDVWRDPLPADAGRRYARPGEEDSEAITDHLVNPPAKMPDLRDWVAQDLIPAGRTTLLSAEGDSGKSLLALQLAATIVTGGGRWPPRWKGRREEKGAWVAKGERVLLVTWEDEPAEIRRRMEWTAAATPPGLPTVHGIPAASLEDDARNRIDVLDMRRVGGALWGPIREGSQHTSTMGELSAAGRSVLASLPGYALCVVDPVAAAFSSNENDRGLVRAFVSAIDLAAEESNCAVLLAAHPPKGASPYAGSTDWKNACRSMLVLEDSPTGWKRKDGRTPDGRKEAKKDKEAEISAPRLECAKSNYAPRSAIWLVRHYEDTPTTSLAFFAASDYEAAIQVVRKLDPNADDVEIVGLDFNADGGGDYDSRDSLPVNPGEEPD